MEEFDPFAAPRSDPLVAPAQTATQSANQDRGSLPPGWVQHVDLNSGKEYYANNLTGETSWSRPQAMEQPHTMTAPVAMVVEVPEVQETAAEGSLRKPSFDAADGAAAVPPNPPAQQPAYQSPPQPYQPPVQPPVVQQQYQAQQQDTPTTLARMLSGKLHGECLARISMRTLLVKEWKPCFWVFHKPNELLVLRKREDYLDFNVNPYLTAEEKEFLVKKRVNINANVTAYPINQKDYGLFASAHTYNFKVEEQRDYGPAILIKFGAPSMSMLEDLRAAINDQIVAERAKGRSAGR